MNDVIYCAGLRILVADDHLASRQYTAGALRQIGAAVKAVASAESALAVALSWCPDAIVTDLRLPGTDGLELIRRIQQAWPRGRAPPCVVLLSADPLAPRGPGAAADVILVKPATPAQLRAALRAGLADRSPHDAVQRIGHAGVCEAGDGDRRSGANANELHSMFRQELAAQLPALEASLAARDLRRAAEIAHRLLASSRLCRERRLELSLRTLQAVCREGQRASDVARAYYELLAAVDACATPLRD